MQTVIGLVAAGVGISLVAESVRELVRVGVTYRPLRRLGAEPAPGHGLAGGGRIAAGHDVPGDGARGGPRRRRERSTGAGATLTSHHQRGGEICIR